MRPEDAEVVIRESISVTRQKVAVAKSFALEYFRARRTPTSTDEMVGEFLESVHADPLEPSATVVLQHSGEWVPSLEDKADAISWKLAVLVSVLELVHLDILVAAEPLPRLRTACPIRSERCASRVDRRPKKIPLGLGCRSPIARSALSHDRIDPPPLPHVRLVEVLINRVALLLV